MPSFSLKTKMTVLVSLLVACLLCLMTLLALTANYPLAEGYRPIGQVPRIMLGALACLLALSVLVVRTAIDRLMAPLSSFTGQVATISASDEFGGPAVFNRLMEDLARHKKELRDEKEFESSLLQHSSLPTFVIGTDHLVLHWNNSCEAMTGVPAAAVVGTDHHWRAFFDHPRPTLADLIMEGGERLRAFHLCCEQRGEGYHAEGWYAGLNGKDRYEGYSILDAVDGEDGAEKFRTHRHRIDLLLLDLVMPRKNGRLAFEEMRALDPGIRALFMSGYAADTLDAKGVVSEEHSFVSKPIQIDRLLLQIREMLDDPARIGRGGASANRQPCL